MNLYKGIGFCLSVIPNLLRWIVIPPMDPEISVIRGPSFTLAILKVPNFFQLLDELFSYTGELGNFLDHIRKILCNTKEGFVCFCKEQQEFHYLN
ncbi:hypothetical protein ES705_47457 [subsurface metagenome]